MISILITIGFALSMDTFSLALSLGTLNFSKKSLLFYPLMVGIFHFIYPILGRYLGEFISSIIIIGSYKLLGIIFLCLFLKLLYDFIKQQEIDVKVNNIYLVFLAFLVSIDSFTTGIGIKAITNSLLIPSIIFLIESSFFTLLGIIIGKKANENLGMIANIFGLILLFILAVIHLCK